MSDKLKPKYSPSPEFSYFVYCGGGDGFMYFATPEDRDKYSEQVISEHLDEGWSEEVKNIVAGQVTHSAQMVNKVERPADLDEDSCDADGEYWDEFDYKCGYELLKLQSS